MAACLALLVVSGGLRPNFKGEGWIVIVHGYLTMFEPDSRQVTSYRPLNSVKQLVILPHRRVIGHPQPCLCDVSAPIVGGAIQ